MPTVLVHNAYGKSRVRLTKVQRHADRHDLFEWSIDVQLTGDFAARSRDAALTEAASLVSDKAHDPAANQNEPPFRRQE